MQSEAEAVRAAESCVLGAAERHMDETYGDCPKLENICHTCQNFVPLNADDGAEILRVMPYEVDGRYQVATHLRVSLGVCRLAVNDPNNWMGVLYARDNPCDDWEARDE